MLPPFFSYSTNVCCERLICRWLYQTVEVSRNGRLIEKFQCSSNIRQDRNAAKLQLWDGNINNGSLSNTWQKDLLEQNSEQEILRINFFATKHWTCSKPDISIETHWPVAAEGCQTQLYLESSGSFLKCEPRWIQESPLSYQPKELLWAESCQKLMVYFLLLPKNAEWKGVTFLIKEHRVSICWNTWKPWRMHLSKSFFKLFITRHALRIFIFRLISLRLWLECSPYFKCIEFKSFIWKWCL